MKILHVAQKLPGGVSSYLCELVPFQLKNLGKANVLVLGPEQEAEHVPTLPRENWRFFPDSRRTPLSLLRLMSTARRVIDAERPDIIHLHSSFAGAIVRAGYLLWPCGYRPKIVYCSHGWAFNMAVPLAWGTCYALMERILAARTDSIPCISRHELKTAALRGLPRHKLKLVYNGVTRELPVATEAAPHFDPGRLNLLFVGRQDRQKGFDLLREAMARVRDLPIHLHAVGDAVVAAAGTATCDAPNITQHGWQPRDRVLQYLAAADALIMPSLWEGFGLVAAEAMRHSRAVLASNVDALPELVVDGVTGHLFAPSNVESIVQLLRSLDQAELREMGDRGRQRFLDLFDAERMNRQIVDIYSELLEKPGRS